MRVSLDPARKGELIATINIDSKSDAMKSDSRMDQQSKKESLQPKTAGDEIIINGNRSAESTQHSNISERSSNVNINVTSSNDITEQVMPKPPKRAQVCYLVYVFKVRRSFHKDELKYGLYLVLNELHLSQSSK
ncbi:unnamed protein product [Anisakis simplex]|uniref:Ovule protein n=1 Tax=Anisakis simplex TaxID=6269 RepID=A0A0M3JPT0_ANISI|nr:unnamed protein product [Anisakis simplex]